MATGRSFAEYVKNKCYNCLYSAAERYTKANWDKLDLYFRHVNTVGELTVHDVTFQRVYINNLPGTRVAFEVAAEVDLEVRDRSHRYDEHDECFPWIRIFCEGDLAKGLDDWKILRVEPYSKKDAPLTSLSDALVPYIKTENMDKVATQFLKEYYPEALKITPHGSDPVWVDPVELAKRLKLTIKSQRIREDASVFGQLYFVDTEAELFDANLGENKTVSIPAKTIVVDPLNFLLRNLGSQNNTIVHECVHWVFHRKAFELEKLFNQDASCISCEVVGGAAASIAKKATEMMERQASQLAPRIQMPAEPFKAKANEYIAQFMRETGAKHPCDVMEMVISKLETVFAVSRQAAKIRLVELGFDEAIGTYTYVDNHYVRPHGFKKGSLKVNQTFTLSQVDAAIQRFSNLELRKLTETGDYLFVENHYVYNAPLYVEKDDYDRLVLTDYALSHMDECCLAFDLEVTSQVSTEYHIACYLNREPSNVTFEVKYHNGYQNAPQERQVAMRQKEMKEALEIRAQMTDDPEKCMNLLLDWRGMKYTDLGEKIGRDPKTISRTVKGTTAPKVETAALICFGLNLPPVISEKLMDVLGCKLKPMDPKHQWINEALHVMYPQSIYAVQEYLEPYGVDLGVDYGLGLDL